MSKPEIGSYRDAEGARHSVAVRQDGDRAWEVLDLDVDADAAHIVETLSGDADGRPQAEAIARDYLTSVDNPRRRTGRAPAEAISEQGGRDAHSHRRPRTGAHPQPTRATALPRPTR